MLSLRLSLPASILALSGAPRQLSQRESLFASKTAEEASASSAVHPILHHELRIHEAAQGDARTHDGGDGRHPADERLSDAVTGVFLFAVVLLVQRLCLQAGRRGGGSRGYTRVPYFSTSSSGAKDLAGRTGSGWRGRTRVASCSGAQDTTRVASISAAGA
mgnify:CR=1 FL=1